MIESILITLWTIAVVGVCIVVGWRIVNRYDARQRDFYDRHDGVWWDDRSGESLRRWRARHPPTAKPFPDPRHARLKQNGGKHTAAEWEALVKAYGYRCLCCGKKKPLTKDHIVPVTKGGSDAIDNLQPLCKSCNSRKGTQMIDYRPQPRTLL